jgi:nicotinamide riboside transporter PnuC
MLLLSGGVTAVFYFILAWFNTANLFLSTLSVTTSFIAAYLSFRRSPFFAVAYAANDVILIGLWILASMEDPRYVSVVVCFIAFLFNDLYGFYSWLRMAKRQGIRL